MKVVDLAKMRSAGRAAAQALRAAGDIIRPGITTDDINRHVHNFIARYGAYPATLNYRGFPKSCCISVNDVVCHGIPGPLVLCDGDIVNVDVTTILDGHFGDTNVTFLVGEVSPEARQLVALAHRAMHVGIDRVRPGAQLRDIGRAIQAEVEAHGCSVVREFGGHGVGTRFHGPPHVSHYDDGTQLDYVLSVGETFTIEPMVNAGEADIYVANDGWTVRTADGSWSAQFEHTLLVTDDGCEILTLA